MDRKGQTLVTLRGQAMVSGPYPEGDGQLAVKGF